MTHKMSKTQILMLTFLSLAVVFSLGIGSVAADQSQIYVNPLGNDSWDGQYATWQNTTFGPKQTIKNATGTVAPNGVVYIANGTYNENNIGTPVNMAIIGESRDGTIINGTNTNRIFSSVNTGISLTIANLTLTNGRANSGGAIWNYGYVTADNCNFTNNVATNGGGGAIYSQPYAYGYTNSLTVTNCNFISNSVLSGAGGGAISCSNSSITNSNFINNSGPTVGAISGSSSSIVKFNRFIGNTPNTNQISSSSAGLDATLNWWGSNTSPSGKVSNGVNVTPWLVLTAPTGITLAPGSSSLLMGDLQHASNGTYYNPANGHVPNGIPVTFAGDGSGSVNPLSGTTLNGLLITNFTAISGTVSHPTFTVDGVVGTGTVNIASVTPTSLAVNPASGTNGNSVNLIATLTNGVTPINGQSVNFYVNGGLVGSATTISGTATLPYTIVQGAGIYQILAQFLGTVTYSGSTDTNNLTVNYIPTNLTVNVPANYTNYQDVVNLTATLKDTFGNNLVGQRVYFNINGYFMGSSITNGLGVTTLPCNLPQDTTSFQALAYFLGNNIYSGSNVTNSFILTPSTTSLTVAPATSYYNNTVSLTANLTDTVNNIPIVGKTITFTVNGTPVGNATTAANGIATLSTYRPLLPRGIYEIFAQFAGTAGYISSSGTNNLTINLTPTAFYISPTSVSTYYNTTINLSVRLRDNNYNYLNGKTVNFSVNGVPVGSVVTNTISGNIGTATIPYIANLTPGTYQILVQFAGDSIYNASNATYTLIINYNPTKLNATAKSGYFMDTINLTATLKDTPNNLVSGRTVNFSVNGNSVGSATTNATGVATLPWTINLGAGIYTILAQFMGEGGYNASNSTNNLTVSAAPSTILVNPVTGYNGDLVNLNATLTDVLHSIPISGKTISFTVNGVSAGSVTTDASGVAILQNYLISQNVGLYSIIAQFAGDNTYTTSNGTNTLNVNYIPTTLLFNPISGNYGSLVNLTATLTDIHNNVPVSGRTVNFSHNGIPIGTATTNASGVATLENPLIFGLYLAQFVGDTIYSSSSGALIPSVVNSTQLIVDAVSGLNGNVVNLTATLTDAVSSSPLSGKTINFSVNGNQVGSATTNNSGIATLPYTIALTAGIYPISTQFAGDPTYGPISGTNNLTVLDNTPPTITANPAGGVYNSAQTVTLTTTDPDSPATTYYTTDGSDPQTSGTRSIYSSPISITSTTTLRFSAVDPAGNWSPNYTENYTINYSFTIDQIKAAASILRNQIETNYSLPTNVIVGGTQITTEQFLELLATATIQINSGNFNPIPLGTFSAPTNPNDNIVAGNIYKSEYLQIANAVKNYMDSTGKTPDYAYRTSLGTHLGYQNLVYMYSMIMDYYNTSGNIAGWATMRPWSVVSSPVIANFTIDQIKVAASTVRQQIETNHQLPTSVTINGINVNMSQFLELAVTATIQINSGTTNLMALKNYTAPANPKDNIVAGNIYKSEYLQIASDIKNYMDNNGIAPDYAYGTSLGTYLGFQNLVYMYSMIMDYYNTSGNIAGWAAMKPWSQV